MKNEIDWSFSFFPNGHAYECIKLKSIYPNQYCVLISISQQYNHSYYWASKEVHFDLLRKGFIALNKNIRHSEAIYEQLVFPLQNFCQ